MREWLAGIVGANMVTGVMLIMVTLIIALAFVILLAIFRGFSGTKIRNTRQTRQARLAVMDAAVVDSKRRLVLIRRDNVEHLVMIGGPSDIVVEQNIKRRLATPVRPVPQTRPAPPPSSAQPKTTAAPQPKVLPPAATNLEKPTQPQAETTAKPAAPAQRQSSPDHLPQPGPAPQPNFAPQTQPTPPTGPVPKPDLAPQTQPAPPPVPALQPNLAPQTRPAPQSRQPTTSIPSAKAATVAAKMAPVALSNTQPSTEPDRAPLTPNLPLVASINSAPIRTEPQTEALKTAANPAMQAKVLSVSALPASTRPKVSEQILAEITNAKMESKNKLLDFEEELAMELGETIVTDDAEPRDDNLSKELDELLSEMTKSKA